MIPRIPIADVLDGRADDAIMAGAAGSGFLTLSGVDAALGLAEARQTMLGFFRAPEPVRAATVRHKYDPAKRNVYRGHFPHTPETGAMLAGFDIGPDLVDPSRATGFADPLTEPTPLPDIPGWAEAAATYYAAMTRIGDALNRAVLRGIGADEALAHRLFARSIASLRLLHYPPTAPEMFGPDRRVTRADGSEAFVMTQAHTDSGFVTLLWQDGTGGLQAKNAAGDWVDVTPDTGGLVVNFGQMLNDWTCGRVKATPHRVLGGLAERHSVPFFYEPAVDAVIEPLFPDEAPEARPFVYGDFLWQRIQKFPAFAGVDRRPAA